MKKIILSFALLGFILLGTASTMHATTNLYFKVTLTDNCSPGGWPGDYYVEIQILANGVPVANAICTNVTTTTQCYTFVSNIIPIVSNPVYSILVVDARRSNGTCDTPQNTSVGGSDYFSVYESCIGALSFSVTVV